MAAYASLVSLMNIIDNIQNYPRFSTSIFDKKQVNSLGEKLGFLLDFIESDHSHDELLESQIAFTACAAEDVIESHVVDRIQTGSVSSLDLQTVIEDMDADMEKVVHFKEEMRFKDYQQGPTYSLASPSTSSSNGKSEMVGFADELLQLLDALTGRQSSLQIISIVDMGGIGKTTLARSASKSRLILNHFDIRAWVTISQEYSVKDIFSKLLSRQSDQRADEQQLAQELYQSLIGRRYLVILDDIWGIEVWDKIKFFFPDNNNGSRVVVTSRLSNVAIDFGMLCLSMKFLDEDKSWKLFCKKAFPEEGCCPPELEEIGKRIVEKCKGLPLLIVVIGGLVRKSSKTQAYLENILKNMNSISDSEEQNLDILSLSYSQLPAHLKPCFLYMGAFPEDDEIHVSDLIKLWVAEGFVKPNKIRTLEEIAEDHLKDLVDRNLLLVSRLRWNGKIKTCTIHDLLRDLCIKAAEKERFLFVMSVNSDHIGINKQRRVVCHKEISLSKYNRQVVDALEWASLIRSFVTDGDLHAIELKLLRVLSASYSDDYPLDKILEQVNLCYVFVDELHFNEEIYKRFLSPSISRVWNLQTLVIRNNVEVFIAPPEIWEMAQLRHVEFKKIYLPDPPSSNDFVLQNLQTIKGATDWRLSGEVCKRIPNLKKLKIKYCDNLSKKSPSHYCLYNIGCLHELETLNCNFVYRMSPLQSLMALPSSLKKLTLRECCLCCEDLRMIGSLPHLHVLKLRDGLIIGSMWDPVEGGFLCLKFLKIHSCDGLKFWNADSSHFPVLENLQLVEMDELVEIPSCVGEIPTLVAIELVRCSESAAISAVKILEEQESLGNEGLLRVRIGFWREEDLERFKEKMEEQFQSFKSNNFQLDFFTRRRQN